MWSGDGKIIAIFCADIHLSLKAPVWRSAELNWLEAQLRPLQEIRLLQEKYDCPIFCAGDIFDRWNCSPELINWAIEFLPDNIYAIPGQHDLPLHQYEDIHRSAYFTLVKAGKIQNILPGVSMLESNIPVQGFPFGYDIKPHSKIGDGIEIAIVHDYVWSGKHHYPNAPADKRISHSNTYNKIYNFNGKLYGYDIIVYGDNHKGFLTHAGKTTIFNCGTLMRRKSDEIDYRPRIGLLLESGVVVSHYLDISKDKHLDEVTSAKMNEDLDLSDFMDELEKLGKTALDFKEAMKEFLSKGKTLSEVKQIILKAMEK